eukprot:CAMPEP_0202733892 /NCGR_PEP_ID=MMETSP1385-20130828/188401_1 /ASSEMBLY_ACC=CAM_ASM_000861 /TAXON_ID=933848 /ORGANISM="Elphidium margaritaceum" /LENGTH=170 /DNA_ID=CAMNT_0049400237 /DNA_START=452 /DNA_END=964 /DNA_ORIENTATION=+
MKQQQLNSDLDRDLKRSIFMDALNDVLPVPPKTQHVQLVQTHTFNGSEIQALTQMHTQLNQHDSRSEGSRSGSIEMGMAAGTTTAAAAMNGHTVHMSGMDELDQAARRYTVTGDYGYEYDRPMSHDSEDSTSQEGDSELPPHNDLNELPTKHAENTTQNTDAINLFHIDI